MSESTAAADQKTMPSLPNDSPPAATTTTAPAPAVTDSVESASSSPKKVDENDKTETSLAEAAESSKTTSNDATADDQEDMTEETAESSSTSSSSSSTKEPKTLRELTRAFRRLEASGMSVLKTTVNTFRSADFARHEKGDVYADNFEKGMELLKGMIEQAKEKKTKDKKKDNVEAKWAFRTVPYEEFGKTLDDVLMAFLKWAIVETDDEEEKEETEATGEESTNDTDKQKEETETTDKPLQINITKAFKRLESYVTWMEGTGDDLLSPPLTAASIQSAWNRWKMKISYDTSQRLIWWFDIGSLATENNMKDVKSLPPAESLRLFVWLAHYVMFDENAQNNGMIFIENFHQVNFWSFMTMVPVKLGMKVDKLTIGVLPVKMKELLLIQSPLWCDVMMTMISPFLSKKMKGRIQLVHNNHQIIEDKVGIDNVPVGFANCEGKLERDFVAEQHFPHNDKEGEGEAVNHDTAPSVKMI